MSTETKTEQVRVRWAGEVHSASVIQRFKNGKVKVEIAGTARWVGGRPGSSSEAVRVTVEPWQIEENH